MTQTLIISHRGQITLPVSVRKRFGIKGGGVLLLEERNGEIVLKPAAVMEVGMYSDKQIREWDKADILTYDEREQILNAIK